MKLRLAASISGIFIASALGGCVQSCYQSEDTVVTQISIGDPSEPDISIPRFPAVPTYVSSGCQTPNPVRVELYINPYGYAQNVTLLDPWPNECVNKYLKHLQKIKLVEAPLTHPLEHFRVDIQASRVSTKQCMRISQ